MHLDRIIEALRARCLTFQGRAAGAAQWQQLQAATNLAVPAAFVIPLDDQVQEQRSATGYLQVVRDSFGVIVALSNVPDERGQTAVTSLHAIRAEINRALLGWQLDDSYGPIEYDGGQLLSLDRARLWYEFDFAADLTIGSADLDSLETRQAADLSALPPLAGINWLIDPVEPRDPTRPDPDGPRPIAEGRVDFPLP